MGRWLAAQDPGGPMPALAVGAARPASLLGVDAAVAGELQDLIVGPGNWLAPALRARLASGFGTHGPLSAPIAGLLELSNMIGARLWSDTDQSIIPYAATVDYPQDNPLSQPLMTVAQSIKQDLGLRVATVDVPGWDTHVGQAGQFQSLIGGLSAAVMAFWRDLGPIQHDVSVVVMSEFGRRLRSNTAGGTDHGRGNVMLVLGPQSRGGRMVGRWPGLSNDVLEVGADLAELMSGHMGMTSADRVFPGFEPASLGLWG